MRDNDQENGLKGMVYEACSESDRYIKKALIKNWKTIELLKGDFLTSDLIGIAWIKSKGELTQFLLKTEFEELLDNFCDLNVCLPQPVLDIYSEGVNFTTFQAYMECTVESIANDVFALDEIYGFVCTYMVCLIEEKKI